MAHDTFVSGEDRLDFLDRVLDGDTPVAPDIGERGVLGIAAREESVILTEVLGAAEVEALDILSDDAPSVLAAAAEAAPSGLVDWSEITGAAPIRISLLPVDPGVNVGHVVDTSYATGGDFEGCGCPMCGGGQGVIGGLSGDGEPGAPAAPTSISNLADYLRDGFWDDFSSTDPRWYNMTSGGTGSNGETLYYNMDGWTGTRRGYSDSNGVATATHQTMIQDAFDFYGELLGITFIETTSDADHVDFFFGDFNGSSAFASTQLHGGTGGAIDYNVINVASGWGNGANAGTYNGYIYQTYLHEIGHAMGLGHQGAYNAGAGSPTYANDAQWENDSWALSIMSYWSQTTNTSSSTQDYSYAELISLATVDYEALNDLYAWMGNGIGNAFNGNTVYGVGTNISSAVNWQMALLSSYADTNAFTIVDGDGVDTVDFSNYSANQVLDLRVVSSGSTLGSVSSVGGLTGNMNLAVGTVIENGTTGAGNDILYGSSSAMNTLTGNAGDDTLYGFGMSDVLYGGDGNDNLFGGDDSDYAYGGDGIDQYYSGGSVAGYDYFYAGGEDGDTDYAYGGIGNDAFYSGSSAAGTGSFYAYGGTGDDYLVGGGDYDYLIGGDDHDRLWGYGGNDYLHGGTGNDTIYAGDGNDILFGSSGTSEEADLMYGGDGDDSLYTRLGTQSTIDGGIGVDTVILQYDSVLDGVRTIDIDQGYSFSGGAFQGSWSGLENVTSAANMQVTLIGNAEHNILQASSRDDTIYGEDGNDTLYGNDGNDLSYGGTGNDYHYGGAGNDQMTSGGSNAGDNNWYYGGGNAVGEVDYAYGGNAGAERYYGGSAGTLYAYTYGGNDYVYGGSGTEIMYGGSDYDYFTGNAGNDYADGGGGNDLLYGGSDNDLLYGGTGNDQLFGGTGNDVVYGGGGNDTMYGGTGDDAYYIDSAGDVVDETGGSGIDLIYSTINVNIAADLNFENLILLGTADIDATGNINDNYIAGNSGDNLLRGLDGNDTLYGGGGSDILVANGGSDTMYGGDGDDFLYVYNSTQQVVEGSGASSGYDRAMAFFDYTLGANIEALTLMFNNDIDGTGNALDNSMRGNSGRNNMNGAAGNDLIQGANGNDTINGGAGNDLLYGNGGLDTFVFEDNWGTDRIADFRPVLAAPEVIDLSAVTNITSYADLVANHLTTTGAGDAMIFDGANRIILLGIGTGPLTADEFIF